MSLKTILLALDGSAESRYAAQAAWQIAQAQHCSIMTQNVLDTAALWKLLLHHKVGFIGSGPYFEAYETMLQQIRNLSEKLLETYESFVPTELKSSTMISEGSVPDEILKQLSKADLLVMGHRHCGDVRYENSSTVSHVIKYANKPVLVIQGPLKLWTAARIVLTNQEYSAAFVEPLFELLTSMSLRKEVYCCSDANTDSAREIIKLLHEAAATGNETVFLHNALKQTDRAHYGAAAGDLTLIVVPCLRADNLSDSSANTFDIMQDYSGSSVLFWPVEPRSVKSDRVKLQAGSAKK